MNKKKRRGQKPLYETPEELQTAVDRYFKSIEGVPAFDKNGMPIVKRNGTQRRIGETPPTLTGLARFLGYSSRNVLSNQKRRGPEFRDIVLTARSRCEEFWESALMSEDTFSGASFILLTAFGWKKDELTATAAPAGIHFITKEPEPEKNDSNQASGSDRAAVHALPIDLLS